MISAPGHFIVEVPFIVFPAKRVAREPGTQKHGASK